MVWVGNRAVRAIDCAARRWSGEAATTKEFVATPAAVCSGIPAPIVLQWRDRDVMGPLREERWTPCPCRPSLGHPRRTNNRLRGRRWRRDLRATAGRSVSDRVSLTAAGCAFYATLALFPAISILVSIYGLAFNPRNVEEQLRALQELLPPPAFELITERVHQLVTQPRARLSFGLGISTLITIWSAATGTKSVIAALNLAYGITERRGIIRFQLVGFGLTLSAILGTILGIGVLVLLPAWLRVLGVTE